MASSSPAEASGFTRLWAQGCPAPLESSLLVTGLRHHIAPWGSCPWKMWHGKGWHPLWPRLRSLSWCAAPFQGRVPGVWGHAGTMPVAVSWLQAGGAAVENRSGCHLSVPAVQGLCRSTMHAVPLSGAAWSCSSRRDSRVPGWRWQQSQHPKVKQVAMEVPQLRNVTKGLPLVTACFLLTCCFHPEVFFSLIGR